MGQRRGNAYLRAGGLAASLALLALSFVLNVRFGFVTVSWSDVWSTLTAYDEGDNNQIIVRTARLPRALIAASVGASLAMAGAVMQAMTRNPLASPSVLGINAGASLAVVAAIALLAVKEMEALLWVSLAGAALAAGTVYLIGSLGRDGLSPMKIVLAGAALSALFSSLTQGMLARSESSLQEVLYWLAGSVAGRPMEMLLEVLPYMLAGWIVALLFSRQLNVMAMGDESAKGLGQRTVAVKLISGLVVVVLAGCSVAVAGPIGLIGVIVPHAARYMAGLDYRWLLPYSAVLGASLLLLADLAARFLIMPMEVPVGIMTAALGAPFFISIARKELRRS